MELQILKKFRENDDPELLKVSGTSIETLSKDEIIVELEKLGINGVELCSLGAIDPRQENLAVLLHYAVEIKNAPSPGTSKEPKDSEPPAKVQKIAHERSDVKKLEEKLETLSKKLEEKKKTDEVAELERVRREAKEEAAKCDLANMDVLNQKLVLLESLAAKLNHSSKKEMTMILSRFHANKYNPGFAANLILKLLSTKEEESILDKEQKMLKQYGYGSATPVRPYTYGYDAWQGAAYAPPHVTPFTPWPRPFVLPRMARPSGPRANNLCFKCKKPGHQIRFCPN